MNKIAPSALVALRAMLATSGLATSRADSAQTRARIPFGHPGADVCLQGGLSRGGLHEIYAEGGHEAAATGFAVLLAFRMSSTAPVLWIGTDFSAQEFGELAPTGLVELGLDPDRLLLLRVRDAPSVLRAGHDALSCASLGAVVMELRGAPKALTLAASQRFMLASAERGVTGFALRFNAEVQASAAETRWHIRALPSVPEDENWGNPGFDARLARNRHGRTGQWNLRWSPDDGVFRHPCSTTHSGSLVSASGDRPAASAAPG